MAFWNSTGYTISSINIGNKANDGTGDDIRDAFIKVDNNLGNLSSFLSSTTVDFLNANVATQLNTTFANVGNLVVGNVSGTQNHYGNLNIFGNIVPGAPGLYNLGTAANPFANLYVQNTISTTQITQSTSAGILEIHANITPGGDVQDVGILGNISNNYNNSNAYAFFGHQYSTNNFIYKITPILTIGGNNVITGGFYGNTQFGSQFLSNTTEATSTTTGALQVAGGAGIAANLYVGNQIYTSNIFVGGYPVLTTNSSGLGPFVGGSAVLGVTNFQATTPSTSNSTGAVVIQNGGLGVYGNIYASAIYAQLHGTINPDSASQPYITSLGTLTGLTVSGTIYGNVQATSIGVSTLTSGSATLTGGALSGLSAVSVNGTIIATTLQASTVGNIGATLNGTLSASSQPNVTSLGTLTGLTTTGTIIAATVNAATIGNTGATLTGTLNTASQTNITQVGNLTSLTVGGVTTHYGNIIPATGSNAAINLGGTSNWFNNIYGTAIHAQYADLAENYLTDQVYEPGTVVVVGGDAEVTACTEQGQDNVIGAISTDPAYLMNGAAGGQPIALKGRIPLKVYGPIVKGQRLGTSHEPGHAEYAAGRYSFAIALETDISLGSKIIEAIIL